MKKIIIISGPTASGKTSTSINIARLICDNAKKAEIVNYDSLLFYNGMNIGTAKPTEEEKLGIPHHLIDIREPNEPLDASDYRNLAETIIDDLHQKSIIPIIVGGSGFYIRSLIKGMYEAGKPSADVTEKLKDIEDQEGIGGIIKYLKENDSESLQSLHANDHYRLKRAVEYHLITGKKISDQKKELDDQRPYDFSHNVARPDWEIFHIYLDLPKDEHQKIIEKRTSQMFEDGLIDEVKELSINYADAKPMDSIGYKETKAYLHGDFETLQECQERIVISTRQLAKSQRTFYKKITPKNEFHPIIDRDKIKDEVLRFIQS